ncbi:MAG: glutamyl-tRNA reductase [Acidobacteriota bacterium]
MDLIVVGLNHRTTPLKVREQVAFSDAEAREILARTRSEEVLREVLLLSTCNRTELYGLSKDNGVAELYIRELLSRVKPIDLAAHPGYAYTLTQVESVRHLFRVAAGLDSMVLGEPQILGQVKQAYQLSRESGASGVVLNRLLHHALTAGKRVRSETRIGGGAVSVASAAAELAGKIFQDLSTRSVLLIGVGEMGKLTARHMLERGVSQLTIANRTYGRAERLAREMGGRALPLDRLDEALRSADIVISSTGSTDPIMNVEKMRPIVARRSGRPIYVIDIALPRDFEPAIGKLDGVFLHDMDDMNLLIEKNLEERRAEIPKAEAIVEQEVEAFLSWQRSLVATPAIKKLRARLEEIRSQEVARHRKRFRPEDWDQMDRVTQSLINKILHPLMGHIRDWGGDEELGALRIDTLYEVFDLNRSTEKTE